MAQTVRFDWTGQVAKFGRVELSVGKWFKQNVDRPLFAQDGSVEANCAEG